MGDNRFHAFGDGELLARMSADESSAEDAFAEFYERWADRAYGRAYRLLRSDDDAREIVHDAFISIYREVVARKKKVAAPSSHPARWNARAPSTPSARRFPARTSTR